MDMWLAPCWSTWSLWATISGGVDENGLSQWRMSFELGSFIGCNRNWGTFRPFDACTQQNLNWLKCHCFVDTYLKQWVLRAVVLLLLEATAPFKVLETFHGLLKLMISKQKFIISFHRLFMNQQISLTDTLDNFLQHR